MNVLLLSCLTGDGHNSAARAIQDELNSCGVRNELADPVSFRSERVKQMVSSVYNNMIRKTPRAFGAVYKAGSLYDSTGLTSPVYWANAQYAGKLNDYILKNDVKAVMCTHLYGMEAMTAIRKKFSNKAPCYGILTDYTCIPFLAETDLDGYFIPHESIKSRLVEKGIPQERIFCTGIPVAAKFNERYEKVKARETLGMPLDKKILLIMTGGVGCENMLSLCDEFMQTADERLAAYVLTGRNAEMKSKIDEKYSSYNRIFTAPFTNDVNIYMNAADAMISKSGGLSSTEAAVANVPFVSVKSIPGCETENARFFTAYGMSLHADTNKQAVQFAIELAFDKDKSDKMIRAQQNTINPYAARDIVKKVLGYD